MFSSLLELLFNSGKASALLWFIRVMVTEQSVYIHVPMSMDDKGKMRRFGYGWNVLTCGTQVLVVLIYTLSPETYFYLQKLSEGGHARLELT
jgi:hypothetical protein